MKNQEDFDSLKSILEMHKVVFNFASQHQFNETKNSLVVLHSKVYNNIRKQYPNIPSQVIIKAEQECLSSYKSTKSNKHRLKKSIEKKNLSMRLDKRLYSKNKNDKYSIRITTTSGRQSFKFVVYPKLKELLDKFEYTDPLIYENDGKLFISFTFDNKPKESLKQKLALGVDIGIRRNAACSDGRIIIDRKFNGDKRKLRHLKDSLKSKGTKSARRHLRKLKHKESNKNRNQTHLIANVVLNTEADTIVLENLVGIKKKKNKYQNKRSIGQVPIFELRRVISYKAENQGKSVLLVRPYYTSQIDSVTGNRDGERRGCRFYSKNGLIYDADINASINIAKLSKLPVSQTNYLTYGQAVVNQPIVCKPVVKATALQAPMALA
jgi:putative transposase